MANQDAISTLIVHFLVFRTEQLSDKSVDRRLLGLQHLNTVGPTRIDHHHLGPFAAVIPQAKIVENFPIRSQFENQAGASHDEGVAIESLPQILHRRVISCLLYTSPSPR